MAIPKYDEITRPLLGLLADGQEHHLKDLSVAISDHFRLTEDERGALLPSGKSTYVRNRTGWAGFHLKKAELVEATKESTLRITDAGRRYLETNPPKITRAELMKFEPFSSYIVQLRKSAQENGSAVKSEDQSAEETTPDERIEQADRELRVSLSTELIERMLKMDPFRFEQLVVDLLFAMGYGGSREEAAQVTKKTGDEGIDGVINEDRLGLDVIYVQAKRWQENVGRNEIQSFVGALAGKHAHKGIFITTSGFNQNAIEYARAVPQKVILIDGQRLAELMIEHGIGVTTTRTIALKRIDSDYFEEA
jgi:restriction system protein